MTFEEWFATKGCDIRETYDALRAAWDTAYEHGLCDGERLYRDGLSDD